MLAYVCRDWPELDEQVRIVVVDFEIVAPRVRDDAAIKHVYLADCPSVEAGFFQLEDDVWSLLYRMGFKELNFDRNFYIQSSEDAPKRQLDVFAKDDETVFIVECTHSKDVGPKSVKSLLDKIAAIRPEIVKAVQKHYGRESKLKIKLAVATRNIEWRNADLALAKTSGVPIITDADLSYFNRLTRDVSDKYRDKFQAREIAFRSQRNIW
jgi:hypothetical protein